MKKPNSRIIKLEKKIIAERQHAWKKYPLVFTLLSTYGLVATLYGFEGIIDNVPLLANNPYILLFTGLIVLLLTGALYKKLS